jgi:biotin carboxyl carrier protein
MNIEELSTIAKWMESTDLDELTYSNENKKISLKNSSMAQTNGNFKIESRLINVNSKFIGIFRKSPKGMDKNIKEGDMVKKGDVLGYVEVLNELKEIISPVDGLIKTVSVNDAQNVEYDQPLFFIEPR